MQREAGNQLRIIMSCITFALFKKHNLPQRGIKACSINIYIVPSHKQKMCLNKVKISLEHTHNGQCWHKLK